MGFLVAVVGEGLDIDSDFVHPALPGIWRILHPNLLGTIISCRILWYNELTASSRLTDSSSSGLKLSSVILNNCSILLSVEPPQVSNTNSITEVSTVGNIAWSSATFGLA